MQATILWLLLIASATTLCGQQPTYGNNPGDIFRHIGSNVKYPASDKELNRQGRVLLKFKVAEGGRVDSISIVNPVGPEIDEEAIRVFQMTSGKWKGGEPGFYMIPITFVIDAAWIKDDEEIQDNIDKQLAKGNLKRAISDMEELRRRDPSDFKNLDNLIQAYGKVGNAEGEARVIALKKTVDEFEKGSRIIGRP